MNSRGPSKFEQCLRAARRRKLLVTVPAIVLAVSSGLAVYRAPILYQSSARILVESHSNGPFDVNSYVEKSRELVAKSDLIHATDRSLSNAQAVKNLDRFSIQTDSSSVARPGALVVSYTALDPEAARSTANELAKLLVSQSTRVASPAGNLEPLRSRAAELSARVQDLEQSYLWLTDSRSRPPSASAPEPLRSAQPSIEANRTQQMTIETLNDQRYKFQQQLTDIERRIASQRQLVEQQKKSGSLRNNPTYAILISKRTELQGQRDTLMNRQDLTDKHPRVAAINDQITAIDRQIDELRQQDAGLVSQSPEARELASLESERNRLKLELEVTGREIARRTASQTYPTPPTATAPIRRGSNDSTVMHEYLALKRANNEAATQLQVAESKTEDPEGWAVQLLDEATLPTQSAGPNRALLISLAAAFGLIVGFLFSLIAERGRSRSLQHADDVERFARLPLLASIPKTVTPGYRKRLVWRGAVKLTACAALSAAVTFGLSQFFAASHIFDLIAKK